MTMERPGKIICVGRNYGAHARELGNEIPEHPLIFFKPTSAIIGPGIPIVRPAVSQRVDYEAEIGVVIGRLAWQVSAAAAMSHVAGFTAANDVTARDLQKVDGQWTRAKGFNTFCPLLPGVVPVADWEALEVIGRVNGEVRQHGKVSEMLFPIPDLIAWISAVMTLEPGDLILTGTPEGVGALQAGDQVEVEVPGVGSISNPVVDQ